MIKVSGYSDDLIEVEGDLTEEFPYNHNYDDSGNLLAFSDGTVLRIRFNAQGIWRIEPVVRGAGGVQIEQAADDERTDVATLPGAVWVVHGTAMAAVPSLRGGAR